MISNKYSCLLRLKFLIFFIVFIFSSKSLAMLCPTNFTPIELGFTMEQIIRLCGAPDSQSSYNETISASQGVANGQASGNYYQTSHQVLTQESGSSQQLNDTIQKTLVFTKFIYGKPQPTVLIFKDGRLVERQIIDANGNN